MAQKTYAQGGIEAVAEEMRKDKTIFYMSTDAIPSLLEEFGEQRVRATPIAESAMTGMAIGAAGSGFRPIVDWRQVTFSFVAMDQIVNQASKIHYMFGGQVKFPILFRAGVGGGTRLAAQHSQSPYSMFMNLSGLKIILPSTARDAKGLLKSAIRDNNPVISFESNRLMGFKDEVPDDDDFTIPIGKADIKRKGGDVTVIATMAMVRPAMQAAEQLAAQGVELEIIDPRTLRPLDLETIIGSVMKTNRCVIVHEGWTQFGFGAEIAAAIMEHAFDWLDAPVARVGMGDVPMPYNDTLERAVIPGAAQIVETVRRVTYSS
ncbi:MAG: alpha-ketoacid dehydrogenase subunit beta [Sphingomonadales bacterium]|nr:alpha-ketoacid dehydrogenase subunit beta [Sphingomonadales bacterium]